MINASGCGTTVKDYGNMLADEPEWHEKALQVARLAKDVSEIMVDIGLVNVTPKGLTVAYHSACSMQHGQKVIEQPEAAARCGLRRKDVPEGHLCCGWAGTYQVLQPELSRRLRDRRVANIESVKPDVIAAGNFGCIGNIASGTGIPIAHTVELLDWATGGPRPAGRAYLARAARYRSSNRASKVANCRRSPSSSTLSSPASSGHVFDERGVDGFQAWRRSAVLNALRRSVSDTIALDEAFLSSRLRRSVRPPEVDHQRLGSARSAAGSRGCLIAAEASPGDIEFARVQVVPREYRLDPLPAEPNEAAVGTRQDSHTVERDVGRLAPARAMSWPVRIRLFVGNSSSAESYRLICLDIKILRVLP